MDDISRELPPDSTGATPVSERQKGPEEIAQFERGRVDENLVVHDRLSGVLGRAQPSAGGLLPGGDFEPGRFGVEDPVSDPVDDPVEQSSGSAEPESAAALPAADDAPGEHQNVDDDAPGDDCADENVTLEDAAIKDATLEDATPADGATAEIDDDIDSDEALAAVAAEAEVAEIEDVLGDEEGMPPVPELQDALEVARVVSVLMLTSREGLSVLRLAQACNTSQKLVEAALVHLQQQFASLGLPVELSRVGDTVRWVSGADAFVYLQRLRGVKKMEKLSPAALETLAVVAYRQPVMRGEIEAIRGVKAGPMLRTLLQHKLIRVAGRADVPGKPLQYGTTQHFLERFGIGSLQELPSVKEWKNLG